jgi:hypothetical protein
MTDRAHMPASKIPNLLCYEDLLEAEDDRFAWPSFGRKHRPRSATPPAPPATPRACVYSHRSTVLHAYAAALPDALNCSAADVILPVVPMFHVNAWGLPYSGVHGRRQAGLPRPGLDGKSLYELFETEGVTFSRPACRRSGKGC